MSKKTLYILLVLDLLLIVASIYAIFNELTLKKNLQLFSESPEYSSAAGANEKTAYERAVQPEKPPEIPDTAAKKNVRNMRFTYRNSRPKAVLLLGEFNDFKPIEMLKDESHIWSVSVELKPGEYLYGYQVDDKYINDPNNPRIKTDKDGKKSSLVTVKPL